MLTFFLPGFVPKINGHTSGEIQALELLRIMVQVTRPFEAIREFLQGTVTKSYLAKILLQLLLERSCKSWPSKIPLELLHGAVMQKLAFAAAAQAFARNCRPEVASQSYFLSFCMELHAKVVAS